MELEYTYADYAADKAIELIGIDSPSGYTRKAADWVKEGCRRALRCWAS